MTQLTQRQRAEPYGVRRQQDNAGKDVSFTRSGLIKSPFRDERTPSFHILAGGYGWIDFGDGTKGGVAEAAPGLENLWTTISAKF